MKKRFLMCMGMVLCLLSVLFTGCGEKEKESGTGGGSGGGTATEERGQLEGFVRDKVTGDAIAQASVDLLPTGRKTQTDKTGAFSFSDLKSGSYRLQVRKDGYAVYTSGDIAVSSCSTVKHHVMMEEEQTDLQILDVNGAVLRVLDLGTDNQGVFKLKNVGADIVEWEIPTLAEAWISGFSKVRGKLAPGASEELDITVSRIDMSEGKNVAVVYIGSTAGNKQLKVCAEGPFADIAGMAMVYVQGGTFRMGATSEQGSDYDSHERPVHSVTLSDFYIGKYEVTQAQWQAVMGTTIEQQRDKAGETNLYGVGGNYPMYYVSWAEANEFCRKLSEKTGKTCRLPTEAEWEYAARGGQKVDGTKYAGSNEIGEVAWYGNDRGLSHPVGQKKPNGLGLYDMSGNVVEWCQDWYGSYSSSSVTDPRGPSSGPSHVMRGGSWYNDANGCRVSCRYYWYPIDVGSRGNRMGFRVVCVP